MYSVHFIKRKMLDQYFDDTKDIKEMVSFVQSKTGYFLDKWDLRIHSKTKDNLLTHSLKIYKHELDDPIFDDDLSGSLYSTFCIISKTQHYLENLIKSKDKGIVKTNVKKMIYELKKPFIDIDQNDFENLLEDLVLDHSIGNYNLFSLVAEKYKKDKQILRMLSPDLKTDPVFYCIKNPKNLHIKLLDLVKRSNEDPILFYDTDKDYMPHYIDKRLFDDDNLLDSAKRMRCDQVIKDKKQKRLYSTSIDTETFPYSVYTLRELKKATGLSLSQILKLSRDPRFKDILGKETKEVRDKKEVSGYKKKKSERFINMIKKKISNP